MSLAPPSDRVTITGSQAAEAMVSIDEIIADREFRGLVSTRVALASSLNVPAVLLLILQGATLATRRRLIPRGFFLTWAVFSAFAAALVT